jgi:Na+/pantothenate symporter
MKTDSIIGILILGMWIAGIVGWLMNLYKLAQCDFDTPLKTEIIRAIALPVAPLGAVIGYMDIGEE